MYNFFETNIDQLLVGLILLLVAGIFRIFFSPIKKGISNWNRRRKSPVPEPAFVCDYQLHCLGSTMLFDSGPKISENLINIEYGDILSGTIKNFLLERTCNRVYLKAKRVDSLNQKDNKFTAISMVELLDDEDITDDLIATIVDIIYQCESYCKENHKGYPDIPGKYNNIFIKMLEERKKFDEENKTNPLGNELKLNYNQGQLTLNYARFNGSYALEQYKRDSHIRSFHINFKKLNENTIIIGGTQDFGNNGSIYKAKNKDTGEIFENFFDITNPISEIFDNTSRYNQFSEGEIAIYKQEDYVYLLIKIDSIECEGINSDFDKITFSYEIREYDDGYDF